MTDIRFDRTSAKPHRMIRFVDILSILLFVLHSQIGFPQEVSLPQIEALAIKNNRTLKTYALEIERSQAEVGTFRDMPRTTVETQYGNIQTPFVGDYTVTISQTIESGKYYRSRKDLLESYVQQANISLDLQQLDIRQQVRRAYYKLIHGQLLFELLTQQDSIYRQAARKAALRYKVGETSVLEKMYFETQLSALQNQIAVARNNRNIPYTQLKNLAVLTDTVTISSAAFFEKRETLIRGKLPWLRSIEAGKAIVGGEIKAEQARLKPGFVGGITNQSMNGSLRQFFVTAGLHIPIAKQAVRAKINSLQIQNQVLDAQLIALENQLLTDYQTLMIERSSILLSLENFSADALPNAALLIQTALKQYESGEINYLDFQQIYTQAISVREMYLQRQLDLKLNEISLDYLIGH